MRRCLFSAVCTLLVCVLTAATASADVKIYMSVGEGEVAGSAGASQIWRCDRDGSNPELLYETGTSMLGGLAIDPVGEKLYYSKDGIMYIANLDMSDPVLIDQAVGGWLINNLGSGHGAVVVSGGYVCWQTYSHEAASCLTGGADVVYLNVAHWPDLVPNPMIVGMALDVDHESPAAATSWGEIKAKYK